ncbi:MAG: glycosyl transferase [Chitinophagaceae bacterium BSSC1]|nr:MAG: glycosyl transferase [Chitinophagaceae bacterium BSSC1]
MNTAYLILAHANPKQLERLVDRLAFPGVDIYIHIDKKADITHFEFLKQRPYLFFVKERVKVAWGAYSIVQATVNGLKQIDSTGIAYDIVHLVSGQDYPLKTNQEINDFFAANKSKAFMHTLDVATEWQEAIPRVEYYHFTNFSFAGKFRLEKFFRKLLPKRKMPGNLIAVGRSQWFSITMEHLRYILQYMDEHPEFVRFFNLTWAPDEIVFQTILFASPFKSQMVNDNMRYIDWSGGGASPKTLTMDDSNSMANSGKLFARKFNQETDANVLDWIDQELLGWKPV